MCLEPDKIPQHWMSDAHPRCAAAYLMLPHQSQRNWQLLQTVPTDSFEAKKPKDPAALKSFGYGNPAARKLPLRIVHAGECRQMVYRIDATHGSHLKQSCLTSACR